MRALRVCLVLVLVVLAAASATAPKPPAEDGWRPSTEGDYGEYPAKYEEIGRVAVLAILKDPESARWGRTSIPRREHAIVNQFRHEAVYGYSFCVEVNAKNGYGGYAGMEAYWLLVRNGHIVRMRSAPGQIYLGYPIDCSDGETPAGIEAERVR